MQQNRIFYAFDENVSASDRGRSCEADAIPAICSHLSNDYLNHYSEALMLIEMAAMDVDVAETLREWIPLDYRTYFRISTLRRASDALVAFEALPPARRHAFEALTAAMDRHILAAIEMFSLDADLEAMVLAIELTCPDLRRLIERASVFLNSGGRELPQDYEVDEEQAEIDRLMSEKQ